jgi:hypothetical protein
MSIDAIFQKITTLEVCIGLLGEVDDIQRCNDVLYSMLDGARMDFSRVQSENEKKRYKEKCSTGVQALDPNNEFEIYMYNFAVGWAYEEIVKNGNIKGAAMIIEQKYAKHFPVSYRESFFDILRWTEIAIEYVCKKHKNMELF